MDMAKMPIAELSLDLDVSMPTPPTTRTAADRRTDASSIHALDGRGRYTRDRLQGAPIWGTVLPVW